MGWITPGIHYRHLATKTLAKCCLTQFIVGKISQILHSWNSFQSNKNIIYVFPLSDFISQTTINIGRFNLCQNDDNDTARLPGWYLRYCAYKLTQCRNHAAIDFSTLNCNHLRVSRTEFRCVPNWNVRPSGSISRFKITPASQWARCGLHPLPQDSLIPSFCCSWDLPTVKKGCHWNIAGMDYTFDAIFQMAAFKINEITLWACIMYFC